MNHCSILILIIIACSIIIAFAYYFIPVVRYVLIPLTAGTKAPETLGMQTDSFSQPMSELQAADIVLANQQGPITSIDQVPIQGGWINSVSLDLKQLRKDNNYILIDFWTYTCINCIRATPYTQELWERYKDHGLVVIGVHSPEFEVEKDPKNILAAVKKAGITYPVLTDGDMVVWRSFGNHFWPGKYLISPTGSIVYTKFGEGDYRHEEEVVRKKLRESGHKIPAYGPPTQFLRPISKKVTPELYAGMGFLRKPFGNQQPQQDTNVQFSLSNKIEPDYIYLQGTWRSTHDYSEAVSDGQIVLNYLANAPYIVLDTVQDPLWVEVLFNNQPVPQELQGADIIQKNGKTYMVVDQARLYYPIANNAPYQRTIISFKTPAGLRFYSFTFGTY